MECDAPDAGNEPVLAILPQAMALFLLSKKL